MGWGKGPWGHTPWGRGGAGRGSAGGWGQNLPDGTGVLPAPNTIQSPFYPSQFLDDGRNVDTAMGEFIWWKKKQGGGMKRGG